MIASAHQVRGVLIPSGTEHAVSVGDVDASEAGIVRAVGGGARAQVVLLGASGGYLYCNENGKALGLAPNPRATRLVDRYVPGFARIDMIMGPTLVVGMDDEGWESDVPDLIARAALSTR